MKTALTIGYFDGVHLGHQHLLHRLRKHPHATILTFSNHPKSFLSPPAPVSLIPLEEKLELLRPFADQILLLPFDHKMAHTSFEELLSQFDLSHLLLGFGAIFGKNRLGTPEAVAAYAKTQGFSVEYLPKISYNGEPISSSRIRKAMREGNEALVTQLLGRT
jgi:riboflavin kinase / FMN adenylyltransferase